jgi:hypothetical protein
VAHTCNLSYRGGRDQENHGSKPAWANSSVSPYLEKPFIKSRAGGVTQGEGPELKHQYCKKRKKKKKKKRKRKYLIISFTPQLPQIFIIQTFICRAEDTAQW